jgi:hypothetical protein
MRPLLVAAVVTALLAANGSLVLAQPVATITLPAPGAAKQLYPGCNNIALSFPDGTPSATVLQAVTPAGTVDTMWRHSAALNKFEGYSAQFPQASDLLTVNFMDAVWLCMAEGLAAVQPPPAVVLPPPVLQVCNAPAVAAFAANPSTITAGQATTLGWGAVTDADTLTIDQGIGQVTGPVLVSPLVTTTYTLTATGCGGTTTYQTTVTVNPPSANLEPIDLFVDWNAPNTPMMLTIENKFGDNLTNVTIGLDCTMEWYPPGAPGQGNPQSSMTMTTSHSITVAWGATTSVDTGLPAVNLLNNSYVVYCTMTPVDFTDTSPLNSILETFI